MYAELEKQSWQGKIESSQVALLCQMENPFWVALQTNARFLIVFPLQLQEDTQPDYPIYVQIKFQTGLLLKCQGINLVTPKGVDHAGSDAGSLVQQPGVITDVAWSM